MTNFTNIQPSLVITETIVLEGIFPSHDDGTGNGDPLTTIGYGSMFAFNFAPRGYALSYGQILSIAQNTALFSILGTTYGGNGQTTFALPDLTSSLSAGVGGGPGLTPRTLGEIFGVNDGVINPNNLPVELGGSSQPFDNTQESLTAHFVINVDGIFPGSTLYEDTIGVVRSFYGNFDPAGTMACDGRLLSIANYTALFSVIGTTYGGDGVTTFALPDLRGRTITGAGQGPGLDDYTVGQVLGTETATLSLGNMGTGLNGSNQPFNNIHPSLVMNVLVGTQGIYPSRNQEPLDLKSMLQDLHIAAGAIGDGRAHMQVGGPLHTNNGDPEIFLGELLYFAGSTLNFNNAVAANGQILSIAQNQALFSLLGTQFGGNGVTTFALPDLRGRSAMGSSQNYPVGTQLGSADAFAGINDVPGRAQIGDENADYFIGGSQDDDFFGTGGADRLVGGGGNDLLRGGDGDDLLEGGAGNDTLASGTGLDQLIGGGGDDSYYVATSAQTTIEDADGGTDTVFARMDGHVLADNIENLTLLGSTALTGTGNALANIMTGTAGNNIMSGEGGNDTIDGGGRADTLNGGDGNDALLGGAGGDILFGDAGDDVLTGGSARDVVTGGSGADRFAFADGDFAGLGPNSSDRIADFSQTDGDSIDLAEVDAITGTPENEGFTFIGDADFSGTAGELRFAHRPGNFTILQGDTNGDGVADFAIRVDGLVDLTAGDFVL